MWVGPVRSSLLVRFYIFKIPYSPYNILHKSTPQDPFFLIPGPDSSEVAGVTDYWAAVGDYRRVGLVQVSLKIAFSCLSVPSDASEQLTRPAMAWETSAWPRGNTSAERDEGRKVATLPLGCFFLAIRVGQPGLSDEEVRR